MDYNSKNSFLEEFFALIACFWGRFRSKKRFCVICAFLLACFCFLFVMIIEKLFHAVEYDKIVSDL